MGVPNTHGDLAFSGTLNEIWFGVLGKNSQANEIKKGLAVRIVTGPATDAILVAATASTNAWSLPAGLGVAATKIGANGAADDTGLIACSGYVDFAFVTGTVALGGWLRLSGTVAGVLVAATPSELAAGRGMAICDFAHSGQTSQGRVLITPWRQ